MKKPIAFDFQKAQHVINLFNIIKLANEQPSLKVLHDVAMAELATIAANHVEQMKPEPELVKEEPYKPVSTPMQAGGEPNGNRRV